MDCANCNTQNPEGAKYCSNCGICLDLSSGPLKDTVEASVRQEVDRALQQYTKEQKIVEFDVTEKVTNRLLGWAKILGTLIGALLVVAGFLGVKSLKDLYDTSKKELQHKVETAKQDVDKQKTELSTLFEEQKKGLTTLTSDYNSLHDRYAQLNSKLPEYEKISQTAIEIKAKLDGIANSLAEQDKRIGKLDSQVQTLIGHIGKTDILGIGSGIAYESGMQIDADGAPHAYHPDGKSGLAPLPDAGRPGNWFGLITDSGLPDGNPIIQTANDPAPGFYVTGTSLQDPSRDRKDPQRYVNSEAVNYIVVPGGLDAKVGNQRIELGNLAVVIRPQTGAHAYAIVADIGPSKHIGEGSIALANALGIPSSYRTGGVREGIVYVAFPGSGQGWPLSQQDIDQQGASLFSKWGGMEKAKSSFQKLTWR